jgi:hypothetical protein
MRSHAVTAVLASLLWSASAWKFKSTIEPKYNDLKGTEWYWNEWRSVQLHADGTFWAPSAECQAPKSRGCRWSAHSGYVWINWGDAGLHRVKLLNDGERLSGEKHDGEECSADLLGDIDRSGGISGALVSAVEMLGVAPLIDAANGASEMWAEVYKHFRYKRLKRMANQLYEDVHRDFYLQLTWTNIRQMAARAARAHNPVQIWKDKAFRTIFFILGVTAFVLMLMEATQLLAVKWLL